MKQYNSIALYRFNIIARIRKNARFDKIINGLCIK